MFVLTNVNILVLYYKRQVHWNYALASVQRTKNNANEWTLIIKLSELFPRLNSIMNDDIFVSNGRMFSPTARNSNLTAFWPPSQSICFGAWKCTVNQIIRYFRCTYKVIVLCSHLVCLKYFNYNIIHVLTEFGVKMCSVGPSDQIVAWGPT